MSITARGALQYALVGIAASGFMPLAAQQPRLSPAEIGRIVDAVLGRLIPPNELLSRVSVAQRGILFDHARTMAAFGYAAEPVPLRDLGLKTVVASGHRSLLNDCTYFGDKPCRQLGWGVYAWIEPLSVTQSGAVVRANILWPERVRTAFQTGVAPTGWAALVSFSTDVQLARSADGTWVFVKDGPVRVSD